MIHRRKKAFQKYIKKKSLAVPILIITAIPFFTALIILALWLNLIFSVPEPVITFLDSFQTGGITWETNDATLVETGPEGEGAIKLSRSKFMAPYVMKHVETHESPPETLVFSFSVRVRDFTEDAMTLAALQFSNGPLAIVMNREGYLAISDNLLSTPRYLNNFKAFVRRDQWENISLFIDNGRKQVSLYLGVT